MKKQLTDVDTTGDHYWTKVDIRRKVGFGAKAKPITRDDLPTNLDILSPRFDAYDGDERAAAPEAFGSDRGHADG